MLSKAKIKFVKSLQFHEKYLNEEGTSNQDLIYVGFAMLIADKSFGAYVI